MKIKILLTPILSVLSLVLVLAIAVLGSAQTQEKLTTDKTENKLSTEKPTSVAVREKKGVG